MTAIHQNDGLECAWVGPLDFRTQEQPSPYKQKNEQKLEQQHHSERKQSGPVGMTACVPFFPSPGTNTQTHTHMPLPIKCGWRLFLFDSVHGESLSHSKSNVCVHVSSSPQQTEDGVGTIGEDYVALRYIHTQHTKKYNCLNCHSRPAGSPTSASLCANVCAAAAERTMSGREN